MHRLKTLLLLLLWTWALAGCTADAQDEPADAGPNITVLSSDDFPASGVDTHKSLQVFRSQEAFTEAFRRYTTEAIPSVNFDENVVLLVDMGQRSSGGYSIRVTAVETEGDRVYAEVTSTVPGEGCAMTQALTNPYQFITVATTEEVLFRERMVVSACSQAA